MELTEQRNILSKIQWRELLHRADIIAAFGLVAILMIMIIPLPSLLLDLFLSIMEADKKSLTTFIMAPGEGSIYE